MTRSDTARAAAIRRLSELGLRLDERHLSRIIDEPLEHLLEEYVARLPAPGERFDAADILAGFVQLLNRSVPCPRKLTREQALDEAIALLARGYVTADAVGCAAAWHDLSTYGSDALPLVLEGVAVALRQDLRCRYVNWLADRFVATAHWEVRCAMVDVLRESLGDLWPAELSAYSSEQLGSHIFDLVQPSGAGASPLSALSAVSGAAAFESSPGVPSGLLGTR